VQDSDCGDPNTPNSGYAPGICDKGQPGTATGSCSSPIATENLYELATSDYLAAGGSGMRVLQRNTTQNNTHIQQRDALTDYLRQGHPCGYREAAGRPSGLAACSTDADCTGEGDFVCACPSKSRANDTGACATDSDGCAGATGLCVRRDCRDQIAQFHLARCTGGGEPTLGDPNVEGCEADLNACSLAGEECKILSCVDATVGNFTDNRVEMLGR
jgi:5'-nucleotidase